MVSATELCTQVPVTSRSKDSMFSRNTQKPFCPHHAAPPDVRRKRIRKANSGLTEHTPLSPSSPHLPQIHFHPFITFTTVKRTLEFSSFQYGKPGSRSEDLESATSLGFCLSVLCYGCLLTGSAATEAVQEARRCCFPPLSFGTANIYYLLNGGHLWHKYQIGCIHQQGKIPSVGSVHPAYVPSAFITLQV